MTAVERVTPKQRAELILQQVPNLPEDNLLRFHLKREIENQIIDAEIQERRRWSKRR